MSDLLVSPVAWWARASSLPVEFTRLSELARTTKTPSCSSSRSWVDHGNASVPPASHLAALGVSATPEGTATHLHLTPVSLGQLGPCSAGNDAGLPLHPSVYPSIAELSTVKLGLLSARAVS